jgi:DNA internalization-related competence protein ComEC/Rec2
MKNRPLFYVFAGVVLGEGCFCKSKMMAGMITVFCLVLIKLKAGDRNFFFWRKLGMIFLGGLFLGFFLMWMENDSSTLKESDSCVVEGRIKEIGTGKTEYLKLEPYRIDGKTEKGNLLLYGRTKDLLPGQNVQIRSELSSYEAPRNPGQFDLRMYYRCRNTYYSGFFDEYVITDPVYDKNAVLLYRLKKKGISICRNYLSKQDAGIMTAMMFGEKSYMDDSIKERYQKNGIAHILAISGLHISMLGGSLYKLLKRMGMPFLPAGMAAFFIMLPYCVMIGSAVAALRATIMLMIFIGADIKGRHYDFISAVSLAGIFILAESPYYLFDAGFLLSFGAVFAIAVVYPCFDKLKKAKNLWLSLSVWLVLLPIQLWFFYEISVFSLLLNFIVIPLVAPLLAAGFLGVLFSSDRFFFLCHLILSLYEKLLVFPAILTGKPSLFQIGAYLCCLIFFGILFRQGKRKYAVFCITIGMFLLTARIEGGFSLSFLDVGQGDCIIIESPSGRHYMIDGGSSDVSKVGKYRILPFLKAKKIPALEYVMITHFDKDHYSGIEEMIGSYPIKHLGIFESAKKQDEGYQSILKSAKKYHIPISYFSKGDELKDGKIKLSCLFPQEGYQAPKNQQSLVFHLSYGEFDCLLTGDLELEGEEALLSMGISHVEVLKAGHHGSKNATTKALLEQAKPECAILSCGAANRYGHPHRETLKRLKEAGVMIYRTDQSGAVWMEEKSRKILIKYMVDHYNNK